MEIEGALDRAEGEFSGLHRGGHGAEEEEAISDIADLLLSLLMLKRGEGEAVAAQCRHLEFATAGEVEPHFQREGFTDEEVGFAHADFGERELPEGLGVRDFCVGRQHLQRERLRGECACPDGDVEAGDGVVAGRGGRDGVGEQEADDALAVEDGDLLALAGELDTDIRHVRQARHTTGLPAVEAQRQHHLLAHAEGGAVERGAEGDGVGGKGEEKPTANQSQEPSEGNAPYGRAKPLTSARSPHPMKGEGEEAAGASAARDFLLTSLGGLHHQFFSTRPLAFCVALVGRKMRARSSPRWESSNCIACCGVIWPSAAADWAASFSSFPPLSPG